MQAPYFDGSGSNYYEAAFDTFRIDDDYPVATLLAWIYAGASANSEMFALGHDQGRNGYGHYGLEIIADDARYYTSDWRISLTDRTNQSRFLVKSASSGYSQQWELAAYVFDNRVGQGIQCLPNQTAVAADSVAIDKPEIMNARPMRIGTVRNNTSHMLGGVCHVAIVRQALTVDDITAIGSGTALTDIATPQNYWLRDGPDDLTDHGTQGNDLTMFGSPGSMDGPSVYASTQPSGQTISIGTTVSASSGVRVSAGRRVAATSHIPASASVEASVRRLMAAKLEAAGSSQTQATGSSAVTAEGQAAGSSDSIIAGSSAAHSQAEARAQGQANIEAGRNVASSATANARSSASLNARVKRAADIIADAQSKATVSAGTQTVFQIAATASAESGVTVKPAIKSTGNASVDAELSAYGTPSIVVGGETYIAAESEAEWAALVARHATAIASGETVATLEQNSDAPQYAYITLGRIEIQPAITLGSIEIKPG